MAERRKPRKRNGKTPPPKPQRDSKRLTLLDLPPALPPTSALPATEALSSAAGASLDTTNHPEAIVRPEPKRTLLPAPKESMGDASLESLAQLAHRATGVPLDRASSSRMPEVSRASAPPPPDPGEYTARTARDWVQYAAPEPLPTVPSPPPDFVRPSSFPPPPVMPSPVFARPSSFPPPVQMPSHPPLARVPSRGNAWIRTLGVIALSASVGAVVSSAIWGVRSELSDGAANRAADVDGTRVSGAVLAENCATTAPLAETKSHISTAISSESASLEARTTTGEAPRISIDALPVQLSRRRGVTAELVSLDTSSSTHGSSYESDVRPANHRAARQSDAPPRARNKSKHAPSAPPEQPPPQPSRAAVSQAVGRAASAATSCDGGPHDGKVTVTFAPSGAVQSVSLVKGFGDAAVNGCVLRAFGRARVPAFSGDPVQVKKSVVW